MLAMAKRISGVKFECKSFISLTLFYMGWEGGIYEAPGWFIKVIYNYKLFCFGST